MFRIKILMLSAIVGVAMVMASTNPVWAERGNKTTLCHIPDDPTELASTIRVAPSAAVNHMAHGDMVGRCEEMDPVVDVGVEKFEICHEAPPDSGNMFTLLVDADEEQEHLDHLDSSGPC